MFVGVRFFEQNDPNDQNENSFAECSCLSKCVHEIPGSPRHQVLEDFVEALPKDVLGHGTHLTG